MTPITGSIVALVTPMHDDGSVDYPALRKLVDVFFEGSKEQVVTALLDDEKWSEDELDALAEQIEARRKERSGR